MQWLIFYLAMSHQREAVNQHVQKLPITSDERSRTLPAETIFPPLLPAGAHRPAETQLPPPHPARSGPPTCSIAGGQEGKRLRIKGGRGKAAPQQLAPGLLLARLSSSSCRCRRESGHRTKEPVLATLARGTACALPGPARGRSQGRCSG